MDLQSHVSNVLASRFIIKYIYNDFQTKQKPSKNGRIDRPETTRDIEQYNALAREKTKEGGRREAMMLVDRVLGGD